MVLTPFITKLAGLIFQWLAVKMKIPHAELKYLNETSVKCQRNFHAKMLNTVNDIDIYVMARFFICPFKASMLSVFNIHVNASSCIGIFS